MSESKTQKPRAVANLSYMTYRMMPYVKKKKQINPTIQSNANSNGNNC